MTADIVRIQYLIRPTGFLQTRDQLEETQKLVTELIAEVKELREWKSTEHEWPDEIKTVLAVIDGETVPAYWQENQEGDWENGYHHYREWFYLPADDDHFIPLDGDYNYVLWKPMPAAPENERINDDTRLFEMAEAGKHD